MASLFGNLFRVSTFGESHGAGIGCVIDGCPPGFLLDLNHIQKALQRRRPGQSEFTSPRSEDDSFEVLSGLSSEGFTLGTPLTLLVRNQNTRSQDYSDLKNIFRPSHADYTTLAKYGIRAHEGGGRSSARETISRVAAGAVAQQWLNILYPTLSVTAWVQRVYNIEIPESFDPTYLDTDLVDKSLVRCPHPPTEIKMKLAILEAKNEGDTLGGLISCKVNNTPVGLGEPVFDKLEATLARALLSLPASKSFEIGSGLKGTFLKGSQNNDPFTTDKNGKINTVTNNSGGIQGGISNAMPIELHVGFKPVSTLFKEQQTVNSNGEILNFKPNSGRHDSCVLPRAVPMVEAMVWLSLADHILLHHSVGILKSQNIQPTVV